MPIRLLPLTAALAALLLIAGCATPTPQTAAKGRAGRTNVFDLNPLSGLPAPVPPPLTMEEQEKKAEALARYSAGLSYELKGDNRQALAEYFLSVQADPSNETLVALVASRLIQGKAPDKAIELLSQAAALPNSSGLMNSLLGIAQAQAGNTNAAIAANRKAIEKSPQLLQGYQNLFHLYLQNRQLDEALAVLDQAALAAPAEAEYLLELSELYLTSTRGKHEELEKVRLRVVTALDKAAALAPAEAVFVQRLAEAYQAVEEHKKAAEQYVKLLPLFEREPALLGSLRERLTNLYLRAEDREGAMAVLKSIARDNPTNPRTHYLLGLLAHEGRNFEDAVEYLERVIMLDPAFEPAYYELAGVRISQQKGKEALQVIEKARAKFPQSFLQEYTTAVALNGMKDYPAALKHFTAAEVIAKSTDTNRLTHIFYFQLGAAHERNKDYEQAERQFREALKLSPDFPDALNYLGYMWAERGERLAEARTMIERAVKLEPDNAAYLDSMGWVLFKLGKARDALPWIQKAVKNTKEADATLYDHLGDVLAALKKFKDARAAWEQSLGIEASPDVRKKLSSPPAR